MKIHADRFEVASALFGQNAESHTTVTLPALTLKSVLHSKGPKSALEREVVLCTLRSTGKKEINTLGEGGGIEKTRT